LETLDSLEILVTRGLLDCIGSDYRFHQEVVRRVLEQRMSPMRRQLLHRRAGRALEQINRHTADALAQHSATGDESAETAQHHAVSAQHAEAMVAARNAEEYRLHKIALPPQ
jgi:predicted ATPase